MKIGLFSTFFSGFIMFFSTILLQATTLQLTPCTPEHYQGIVTIEIPQEDLLYTDYLELSVDNPAITLNEWKVQQEPINHFDRSFKEHKKAYKGPVIISFDTTITDAQALEKTNLHVTYYQRSRHNVVHETIPLQPIVASVGQESKPMLDDLRTSINTDIADTIEEDNEQTNRCNISDEKESWPEYFSRLLTCTNSSALQLLIIFILGLLMSLTPCIYPMIPVTAGILQAQGSRSLLTSFLLSLSYTLGIAVTFAILGIMAAFAGTALGSLMTQPYFILPIVALLAYLAFSLLGWYEMYTPRFMRPKNHKVNAGSFISAFIFGAISGTVASPCLSPGLVLLLSIVAALKSLFWGFVFLFVFGFGLGIPLLIIGTFSSSLHVLPRAGMWMIEIKKIFGVLLLGMCFYFLNNIIPYHILLWLVTLFVLLTGVMYLHSAQNTHSRFWAAIKNIVGIILVACSVVLIFKSYQALYLTKQVTTSSDWYTDFHSAKKVAQEEQKLIFIDIGTPSCSLCKALDRTLFADEEVLATLQDFTCLKLDGSKDENKSLISSFSIIGFPTILVIDAQTQRIIKKWGPELYGIKSEKFITELEALLE